MKSSLRFSILLVLILVMGAVVNGWSYLGEAHVDRKELKEFPQAVGAWQKTGNESKRRLQCNVAEPSLLSSCSS